MAEIQRSLSTSARTASTRFMSLSEFVKEFKKLSHIAAPMVGIFLFDYLLQVASTMMVGHLGQLQLASVAIATSLTNVVGFSFLVSLYFHFSNSFFFFFFFSQYVKSLEFMRELALLLVGETIYDLRIVFCGIFLDVVLVK